MHQRQKKILDMLQHGKLLIPQAAEVLGVSQMTLRRDLRELEGRKLLLQVKNGAVPHPAQYEPEPAADDDELMQRKFMLANLLYDTIMPVNSLFISTGTTALAFAKVIARRNNLPVTVVTNSLPVASALFKTSCKVILLGGELRTNSLDLIGPAAERNLLDYRVDYLVSGCDAALSEYGFYTSDMSLAQLERKSIQIAEKSAIITDSSKFSRGALTRFAALSDIDLLVTDSALPEHDRKNLQASAIEVLLGDSYTGS